MVHKLTLAGSIYHTRETNNRIFNYHSRDVLNVLAGIENAESALGDMSRNLTKTG